MDNSFILFYHENEVVDSFSQYHYKGSKCIFVEMLPDLENYVYPRYEKVKGKVILQITPSGEGDLPSDFDLFE